MTEKLPLLIAQFSRDIDPDTSVDWASSLAASVEPEHVAVGLVPGDAVITEVSFDGVQTYARGIERVSEAGSDTSPYRQGEELSAAGVTGVMLDLADAEADGPQATKRLGAMALASLRARLRPVIVCGESDDERAAERSDSAIGRQLERLFEALPMGLDASNLTIVYRPAPSTRNDDSYSPKHANGTCMYIRALLVDRFEPEGLSVPILYGGYCTPDSARAILSQKTIGGLVCTVDSSGIKRFVDIVETCDRKYEVASQLRILNT